MAIVKPGQQEAEAQEMADAFGEDVPPPAEQTDDEAFGLTPPDQAGGETPGADSATVTTEEGSGEEVPPEAPAAGDELPQKPETMTAEAPNADGEEVMSPEDGQRAKSWEGRLRKREEELAAREAELKAMEERLAGSEAAAEGESAAEEMAEMESPGGDTDDGMAGGEFESPEQAVAWATENFGPEFVKVIDLIVEARIKNGMGDVDSRLSGLLQRIEDRDVRDHFREIARAEPNFLAIVKSPEFDDWRAGHEQADHYAQVMQDGTADDVIAMLQAFKDSQHQVDGTIVDDDAADGVRSTGAGLVLPEEVQGAADDYLSAFKEFASAD